MSFSAANAARRVWLLISSHCRKPFDRPKLRMKRTAFWAFYSAFVLELAPPLQSLTRSGATALTFPLVYGLNHLVYAFLWGRSAQFEDLVYDRA